MRKDERSLSVALKLGEKHIPKTVKGLEGLHDADKVSKFLHSFSLDINIFKYAVFAGK
jgi:hypothetical protein